MDLSEEIKSSHVKVAVNIKPLISSEVLMGCADSVTGEPQINRDPTSTEMQKLCNQLEQLQSEVRFYRAPFEELQVLRKRVTLLETSNALDAQVEKDKLILKLESARNGQPWDEIDCMENTQKIDLLIGYKSRIQKLEAELMQAQNPSNPSQRGFMDRIALEKGETKDDEKEREHSSLQDRLDKELQKLDKRLEQKQVSKLKKKQEVQSQLSRQKQKSNESTKRLHKEIEKIKSRNPLSDIGNTQMS